jgi:single-strand DNA-binding protein
MAGLNKVMIIGRLGADPESKQLQNGQTVTKVSVATSEKWTGKDGQSQEKTEWHRITVWGKMAENAAQYLKKGSQVYFEGKLATRSWDDKDGSKRYATEITATGMQFLASGSGASAGSGQQRSAGGNNSQPDFEPPPFNGSEDEIPF